MVVNAFYNIVAESLLAVGLVPALAATAVALPSYHFNGIIHPDRGCYSMISIRLGEQKKAEAEVVAGNA
jgi:hypothetical protein